MCEVAKGAIQKGLGEQGSLASRDFMVVGGFHCLVIATQTQSLTLDLGSIYQRDTLVLVVENRAERSWLHLLLLSRND